MTDLGDFFRLIPLSRCSGFALDNEVQLHHHYEYATITTDW